MSLNEATGTPAAATPTDNSTAYPGGGASKNHGGRKRNFSNSTVAQTAREPSDRPKTKDMLKTSIDAILKLHDKFFGFFLNPIVINQKKGTTMVRTTLPGTYDCCMCSVVGRIVLYC